MHENKLITPTDLPKSELVLCNWNSSSFRFSPSHQILICRIANRITRQFKFCWRPCFQWSKLRNEFLTSINSRKPSHVGIHPNNITRKTLWWKEAANCKMTNIFFQVRQIASPANCSLRNLDCDLRALGKPVNWVQYRPKASRENWSAVSTMFYII